MNVNTTDLQHTLNISVNTSNNLIGRDDPNFKRIHHNHHHIVLYIKDYLQKEKCKNYFEIGTHFGHSLSNLLQSKYESKFVSCDIFDVGSSIAPDCKIKDVEALANCNAKLFNTNNYSYNILKSNSNSLQTRQEVMRLLPDGIDLLFIDGDHRYKSVVADFMLYYPLVNTGGYIVFDDYLPFIHNGISRECPIAINDIVTTCNFEGQSGTPSEFLKEESLLDNSTYILKKISY